MASGGGGDGKPVRYRHSLIERTERTAADDVKKRSSYFEMLSNISNELDIMLIDLKKNEKFALKSPTSPLNAASSSVAFEPRESYSTSVEPVFKTSVEGSKPPLPAKTSGKHAASLSPSSSSSSLPPSASMQSLLAEFGPMLSPSLDDSLLSMKTRLVHSKPIWYLPTTQRAAAAHYLQGQPVGTFVVRQARQKDKLSLTLKHPGTGKGPFIESYPIESTRQGLKLSNEEKDFPSLYDLISYHFQSEDALPCRLALPVAIMAARNLREIQSLSVLERDFWKSPHSKSLGSPPKQDFMKLDYTSSRTNSLEGQIDPKYLSNQRQPAGNSINEMKTRQDSPFENVLCDIEGDWPTVSKASAGEYGIITGPPVIYENADRKKFLKRPVSTHTLTEFSLTDTFGKWDQGSDQMISQRPTSEFDRQDMRFSTVSEFEMITSTSDQRYPPPRCAPPPPPVGEESFYDMFDMSPVSSNQYNWPQFNPSRDSGVQYSQPYDQPPLPPKKATSSSSNGKPQTAQTDNTTPTGYPVGYGVPMTGCKQYDPYQAPQCATSSFTYQAPPQFAVGSLDNWQHKQQKLQSQLLTDYSTPPLPASLQGSLGAESPHGSSYKTTWQIQNILQPTVINTSEQDRIAAQTALPEFDPLFQRLEYGRPQIEAKVAADSDGSEHADRNSLKRTDAITSDRRESEDSDMKNLRLRDLEDSIRAIRLSDKKDSTSLNNNTKLGKMAPVVPLTLLPEQTHKTSQIIQAEHEHSDYNFDQSKGYWSSDNEENQVVKNRTDSFANSVTSENTSESDDELMSPTFERICSFPHTENQNGNHLVHSHSMEDSELEHSKDVEKKEYMKRNKSSHLSRMIVLAKKGSKGATRKLRKSRKKAKRDPMVEIHDVILRVASNNSIGLGALVSSFIRTQEEKCMTDKPDVVLRSIRQYMSGIKNYLLNRREPEIDEVIDQYFPNVICDSELEGIIEGALHQCVLEPLKSDIGHSCLKEYKSNGTMELMDHNFIEAKRKSPQELGIKENYIPPEGPDLDEIRHLFSDLQEAFSPVRKLDLLLKIVSSIYNSVRDKNSGREVTHSMGADDFLPMLIYVLVQCEMIGIEIEADYMWGLLDPSMLSGEGGYYLTTLSSAICVLKQFEEETKTEMKGFLTVLVAASMDLSLKTQPVLPGMTAAEVCRNLSHGMELSDAEAASYKLFLLREAGEIPVPDNACPLQIKMDEEADGFRGCRFGFRPQSTVVYWPQSSGLLNPEYSTQL